MVQCAALKIHRSLIIEPPQRSDEYSSKAICHGLSSTLVSKPPTINGDGSSTLGGIAEPMHGSTQILILIPTTIRNETMDIFTCT